MSKSKIAIKLNIVLNGESKTIAFNLDDKFSEFLPLVQSSFKTNLNDYDIYLGNEKLTNYNKTIKEIVGKDMNPLFSIKQKEVTNYNSILDSSVTNSKEIVTRVTVENFPSRPEMLEILDRFVSSNGYSKDYKINNRDLALDILFKDSVNFINIGSGLSIRNVYQ